MSAITFCIPTLVIDSGLIVEVIKSGVISPLSPEKILLNTRTASFDFSATRKSLPSRLISTGLPSIVAGPAILRATLTKPSAVDALLITNNEPSVASEALPTSDKISLLVFES